MAMLRQQRFVYLANPLFAASYGVILKTVPKPAPPFEVVP
jgi:hypothetical protein